MDIGQKLKNARQKAGLTQEQIAEAIGVSRQTVSNWENNRSYPDIASVLRLSEAYGVSLDTLLKEAEDMNQQEQNQISFLEKYWNAMYSMAVVMFPLARICEYYRMDALALVLLGLGAALFCLPRLLFHRLFGGGLKNVALGILGWGLAGTSYALRVILGEFTLMTWTMAFIGLVLVICIRHKEWSGPNHWSQWIVAAMIAAACLIPIFGTMSGSGSTKTDVPYPHTYRAAEILQGDESTAPIIELDGYGNLYLWDHQRLDTTCPGTFVYQKPAEGAQSQEITGIWQLIPEDDASALYRISVDVSGEITASYLLDDILQWKYRLSPVDTLQVSSNSAGVRSFFTPRWFYAGTFDTYAGSLECIEIRGSGKVGFSWKGERSQELTVLEQYYHDGALETREYDLPADSMGLELEPRYETGKQEAIYRIPYEGGEYVFKVIFQ